MPKAQFKVGKRYAFVTPPPYRTRLEFWAENGWVIVLNADKAGDSAADPDEVQRTLEPREFYKRVLHLCLSCRDYADEQFNIRAFHERAVEVGREAVRQNADIQHQLKHGFNNRIVVPGAEPAKSPPKVKLAPKQLILPRGVKPTRTRPTARFAKQAPIDILMNGSKYRGR